MRTALGIDIGGTQVKAARVQEDGAILEATREDTPGSLGEFRRMAARLASEFGIGANAVGIGCKGRIDAATTRIDVLPGTLHYLEGLTLAELFAIPGAAVQADNDARVALYGERRWGAARGRENVLLLTLGTGVGGGVLSHGLILRGAGGVAGHVGHLTVETNGAPCICGNRGCLETVFSSKAIEAAAYSAIVRGVASSLLDGPRQPTCAQVFAAAGEGDFVAGDIIDRAVRVLAGAIAGLALLLDPEIVILGGQIAEAGELLFAPVREQVRERTWPMLRRELPIVPTGLSDPSGVLGAAALALDGGG